MKAMTTEQSFLVVLFIMIYYTSQLIRAVFHCTTRLFESFLYHVPDQPQRYRAFSIYQEIPEIPVGL